MQYKISSLNQFIQILKESSKEDYKKLNPFLKIPLEELKPYAQWSKQHYTRNCIIREHDFELILLCWESKQKTDIHCHGGEECWVYMMKGEIEEARYDVVNDNLVLDRKTILREGSESFMSDDLGYHSLSNFSTRRAMSLHLYMNPINDCTVYDDQSKEFEPKLLSYHSQKVG